MPTTRHRPCDADYVAGRAAAADRLGLACRPRPDGSLAVQAEPHPGRADRWYSVTLDCDERGTVVFACSCPAGDFRPGPVACKHAAAAGRHLERAGLATFSPAGWSFTMFSLAVAAAVAPLRD